MADIDSRLNILPFSEGKTCFGVYAHCVQEVMELPYLTQVPGKSSLRGLFVHKGIVIPVISFSLACGVSEPKSENICLILKEDGGEPIGITVTQVSGLISNDEENLIKEGEFIEYGFACVKSVQTQKGLVLLLDINRTYQALTR